VGDKKEKRQKGTVSISKNRPKFLKKLEEKESPGERLEVRGFYFQNEEGGK